MLIDYPMVKFSSGHHAELEIQDTWGGYEKKFIARNTRKTNTIVLFDEGYLIISFTNWLAKMGGTETASCEKF